MGSIPGLEMPLEEVMTTQRAIRRLKPDPVDDALPLWNVFAARRALGLPRSVVPCAVIPVGWPLGNYGPTRRRPIEDVVSIDQYGNRAWRSA